MFTGPGWSEQEFAPPESAEVPGSWNLNPMRHPSCQRNPAVQASKCDDTIRYHSAIPVDPCLLLCGGVVLEMHCARARVDALIPDACVAR